MKLGKLTLITLVVTLGSFAVSYATAPEAENGKTKPYPLSLLNQWKDVKFVSKISSGKQVNIGRQISAESVEKLNLHLEAGDIILRSNDSNIVTINLNGNFSKEDPLEIEEGSGELTIKVNEESVFGSDEGTLEVSMPITIRELAIATVAGEIEGDLPPLRSINIATVSGGLKFDKLDIPVEKIASVSGDVDIAGKLASVNLVSVSGDVRIKSENPSPALKINSTSGDVEVEFVSQPNVSVSFTSMTGDGKYPKKLGDGSGVVTVETVSGDFELRSN